MPRNENLAHPRHICFSFLRAQGEIVGLLVVVILLIFLGFVYLTFSLRGQGSEYSDVRYHLQAQGLLAALLSLDTGGERFQDLLASCYSTQETCSALEGRVREVFQAALREDEDYHLTLHGGGTLLVDAGGCGTGITSSIPFSFERVFYEGTLLLCRKRNHS